MARLTAAARNALPDSAFAGPNRSYPIEDAAHARNAKSRVAQFGGPALKARVATKVAKKYPTMARKAAIASLAAKRRKG